MDLADLPSVVESGLKFKTGILKRLIFSEYSLYGSIHKLRSHEGERGGQKFPNFDYIPLYESVYVGGSKNFKFMTT